MERNHQAACGKAGEGRAGSLLGLGLGVGHAWVEGQRVSTCGLGWRWLDGLGLQDGEQQQSVCQQVGDGNGAGGVGRPPEWEPRPLLEAPNTLAWREVKRDPGEGMS